MGVEDSIFEELDSLVAESDESPGAARPAPSETDGLEAPAPGLPSLVAEYLPLHRRRLHGDPPLGPAELARYADLRELLDYHLGPGSPPLAGSRRRHLRVPSGLKVRVSGAGSPMAALRDISESGAFLEMPEPPGSGAVLEIDLDPGAGEPPLRLSAVVRWVREIGNMDGPVGAGVEFQNLEDGDDVALESFVQDALEAAARRA